MGLIDGNEKAKKKRKKEKEKKKKRRKGGELKAGSDEGTRCRMQILYRGRDVYVKYSIEWVVGSG